MIFSAINDDCVGDPPGELMIKATAGLFLSANNLSINLSINYVFANHFAEQFQEPAINLPVNSSNDWTFDRPFQQMAEQFDRPRIDRGGTNI